MRTLDERNSRSFSLRARLVRDGKLLLRLAAMVLDYFTRGARIRRRYRNAEAHAGTYWLD